MLLSSEPQSPQHWVWQGLHSWPAGPELEEWDKHPATYLGPGSALLCPSDITSLTACYWQASETGCWWCTPTLKGVLATLSRLLLLLSWQAKTLTSCFTHFCTTGMNAGGTVWPSCSAVLGSEAELCFRRDTGRHAHKRNEKHRRAWYIGKGLL